MGRIGGGAARRIEGLLQDGAVGGMGDGRLLVRFADGRGVDREDAFAALVRRHGPMVLATCRRMLGDGPDADDAFQAVFLVLARRAGSLRGAEDVGGWLRAVTLRTGREVRVRSARARARTGSPLVDDVPAPASDPDLFELRAALDEELERMPGRFRDAIRLCELEGLSRRDAADRLGLAEGTLSSRLARGKSLLRDRLARRGLTVGLFAAAIAPPTYSGVLTDPAARPGPGGVAVPASLVEALVRASSCVLLGEAAPAGVISTRAVLLMKGVLKAMAIRTAILMSTALVVGLATVGSGAAVYSALGGTPGPQSAVAPPPAQKAAPPKPLPLPAAALTPEEKARILKRSEEKVRALIREYETEVGAVREAFQQAKTPAEREALSSDTRANPAAFAGALLYEAEFNAGTPVAEEALFWIASHLNYGTMLETARDVIARDHAESDKIEVAIPPRISVTAVGSTAAERLLREVLDRNPRRETRALACLQLARFLDTLAFSVRKLQTYPPTLVEDLGVPIQREVWGRDYPDRLRRKDADALEREAAALYERTAAEFGDVPIPRPLPRPTGDLLLPARPETYGEAARSYLHELRDLAVGKPAPEIEGVDLDGRPMKLSDYRGKVVVLYFCMSEQLRGDGMDGPAQVTEWVRAVAERHADEPFALLGVSTVSPNRAVDRETFKSQLEASRLPARFWWDIGPGSTPGPIQAAWNGRFGSFQAAWIGPFGSYVIDRRGVIRDKSVLQPALLDFAVAKLLNEPDPASTPGPGPADSPRLH